MARFELSGKVALVTGGARGIGFATAQALIARGASVAIVDLDQGERPRGCRAAPRQPCDRHRRRRHRPRRDAARRRANRRALRRGRSSSSPTPESRRAWRPSGRWRRRASHMRARGQPVGRLPHRRGSAPGDRSTQRPRCRDLLDLRVRQRCRRDAVRDEQGRSRAVRPRASASSSCSTARSSSVADFGFIETEMVHCADPRRPDCHRDVPERVPAPLQKRVGADKAAAAIVRGIERRAPRIFEPRRWALMSLLRGIVSPLGDARMEREERTRVGRAPRRDRARRRRGSADDGVAKLVRRALPGQARWQAHPASLRDPALAVSCADIFSRTRLDKNGELDCEDFPVGEVSDHIAEPDAFVVLDDLRPDRRGAGDDRAGAAAAPARRRGRRQRAPAPEARLLRLESVR